MIFILGEEGTYTFLLQFSYLLTNYISSVLHTVIRAINMTDIIGIGIITFMPRKEGTYAFLP